MDNHEIAYGILLGYLSPVDLASLRRCCRSWKQLVDRTLSSLQPYNLGKLKPHSIYSHIPALYYRLLLSGPNINFISTPQVGSHVFLAVARQFTSLKSLELDCVSKAHLDFGNLRCLPQLTACTLLEFPFNDVAALSDGVGKCRGLTALALQSRKESLTPCRMEHLVHLHHLKSLCLKPRSYSSSPMGGSASLTCLGQLTGLTRLQLLAYEQGLRAASPSLDPWEAATPGSPTTAAAGAATFDGAATEYLGTALRSLRGLVELEVCGCATIPPHIGSLAELRRLSIERLDQVNRADVLQLRPLTALTALTLLAVATHPSAHHTALAAAAADDEDADADAEAAGDIGPAAPSASGLANSGSATAAAAAAGAAGRSSSSTTAGGGMSSGISWTASSIGGVMAPLAELGSLQELVVGTVGMAACQALHGEGPGVTAYVCPLNWDMLSCQGLTHVGVEARGWHSACITAKFPTPDAAQHTLLTWAQQQGMVVTSRSRSPGAGGGPHVYSRHTVHGINVDTLLGPTATAPPRASMGQGGGSSEEAGTRHLSDFGDALIRRTLSLPRQAMSFDTASLAVATGTVSGGTGRGAFGLPPPSRPPAAAGRGAGLAVAATAAAAAAPGSGAAQSPDTGGGSCSHCGASSGSGGSGSRPVAAAAVGDGGSSSDGGGQRPHGVAHRPAQQQCGGASSGTGAAGREAPSVPSSSAPSSNPHHSGPGSSDSTAGAAAAPALAGPGPEQRTSLPGTLSARNDAAAAIWGAAAASVAGDSSSRAEGAPSSPGALAAAAGGGGAPPGSPQTPAAGPAAGGEHVGTGSTHLQQAGNSSPADSTAVSRSGGLVATASSSIGSSISSQQVLGSSGSSAARSGSFTQSSLDTAGGTGSTNPAAAAATGGSSGEGSSSSRAGGRAVSGAGGVSSAASTSSSAGLLPIPSRIQVPSAASVTYSPGPSSATAATSSGAGLGWGAASSALHGYTRPAWGFPEFSWLDVEPSSELAAAAGVFANHPDRGGYLVGWPQCLAFRMAPGLGKLPAAQRVVLQSLIRQLSLDCPTSRGLRFDSPARRLLQAHHRSSLPPAQVLPRLATISSLRRLDLTVDQHWPSAVLHRIGLLARCQQLTCLHLDCGRRDIPDKFWTGLAQLRRLQWLSLRWLESVPLYRLAPLTALRALQLKDLGKPPGAGELAEVVGDMPMLRYLAIEGALLDVSEDFLARLREVVEGGRYTWVWLEHTLSRRMTLQLLGSITAALLLAVLLPRQRLPEMLLTSLLAAFFAWLLFLGVVLTVVLLVVGEYQGSAWWLPWGKPQRQPGAGLKQLRYLSLRRCTFTNSRRRKAAVSSAKGSTLVGLVRALPDLRFLDVMWLNGHQSELAELLHVPQLHYISIGKQQLGRSWHDAVRACSAVVLEAPGGMDEVLERELSCH